MPAFVQLLFERKRVRAVSHRNFGDESYLFGPHFCRTVSIEKRITNIEPKIVRKVISIILFHNVRTIVSNGTRQLIAPAFWK